MAPGVPQILDDFGVDNEILAAFVVSIFILGLAAGPLVLAPISELFGRVRVYHVGNILFVLVTLACALATSFNQLIAFRFLAGLVGAGPVTIGGGSIADLTTMKERGTAISIWSLGPLLGPSIGPIAGGFIAEYLTWRWIFYILLIVSGVVTIAGFLVMRESHEATLLARKTERLRKETGNTELRSRLATDIALKDLLLRAITRPCKILVLSPACLVLNIYSAFVYAIIYIMFSTFSFVFEGQYGFSQGVSGLVYISLGIGFAFGLTAQQLMGDRIQRKLANKYNDGKPKPEYRIPPMALTGFFIPAGLFIYGWTAEEKLQWAVPLVGVLLVGVGICIVNININAYLVDAFTVYAASALAANAVLRSLFGALFPLFSLKLYNSLGYGWGNSVLAFIALALWPVSILFYWYGEGLRHKFPVTL
ncbi:major facilitator superfamily transporter [Xylariaceae sp. FL1019]|nr:major facilitator superfamily transporter [Xylariaceae sp. FL1019]